MSFGSAAGFPRVSAADPCPCGGGEYGGCCAPLLAGEPAPTAERLMRSRYTAFVVGDRAHLERSWHPRTRPHDLTLDPATVWRGLEIVDAAENPVDGTATVEFRASIEGEGALHERSQFVKRAARWVYLEGEIRP